MIQGIGISPGIAMAEVLLVEKKEIVIPACPAEDVAKEVESFKAAHAATVEENRVLYEKASAHLSEEDAAIFLAHEEILNDEYSVTQPIIDKIENEGLNAAKATADQMDELIAMFDCMDDEYMKARAMDARDIKELLLRNILGIEEADISDLGKPTVIVAKEITPSDTARMDLKNVAAFVTQVGGPTSHSAIIARNLEIPAVSQVDNVLSKFSDGQSVIVDGTKGFVDDHVTEEEIVAFNKAKEEEARLRAVYETFRGKPTETTDGHRLGLYANIGSPSDMDRVLAADAEGIGLFRSEFLYMDSVTLPDEETQFKAYKEVLEKMGEKPVIIRTLDIGGDKELPALGLEKEDNPFLGYRAIRICLDKKDLFKTQIRALLRASQYGNLKIMFPMISSISQLREAKAFVNEVKAELLAENPGMEINVPLGMMIEIPSSAILADDFAKEADFFSVGTNDLTQYTLAVDRGNTKVAGLYDHGHPAVLALIKNAAEAAKRHSIEIGVCGEAGGDPAVQEFLVKIGVHELSMTAANILKSRKLISEIKYED